MSLRDLATVGFAETKSMIKSPLLHERWLSAPIGCGDFYALSVSGAQDVTANFGCLSTRIGSGWEKRQCFQTGQSLVLGNARQVNQVFLKDHANIVGTLLGQVFGLVYGSNGFREPGLEFK